jgi:hypothetical protein
MTVCRVLLVFAAAAALAGCGGARKVEAPHGPDRALLSSIVGGMKTDLVSVRVGAPPKGWGPVPRKLSWLDATPATTGRFPQGWVDYWYGALIAGAYNAQCRKRGADCLAGFTIGGRYGEQIRTTHRPPPVLRRQAIARRIRSLLASEDLRVTRITFERPYGLAPVVTATALHPGRAARAYLSREDAGVLSAFRLDGFLLQAEDGRGRTFLISDSYLQREGGYWLRRRLHVPGGKQ